MFPLASMCHQLGADVSGSDLAATDGQIAFPVAMDGSTDADAYIARSKCLVISSAVSKDHPALRKAQASGIRVMHRSEILALFSAGFKSIAVAGTHGKSTTSALITHILRFAGISPSWIIGAPFADGLPSFGLGESEFLVLEADESDGTFLRYSPLIAIVTNIDPDHLDHYGDFNSLVNAFRKFCQLVNKDGRAVVWGDSGVCRDISRDVVDVVTFGEATDADFCVSNWAPIELGATANLTYKNQETSFRLPLTGKHNLLNASAAVAAAVSCGVPVSIALESLSVFPGVYRRMQRYKCENPGAFVFDDYAHNPGKILGCLSGLRRAFPERRLIAVFQPHRYSRVSSLYAEFVGSFNVENLVVVTLPVYSAGEAALPGFGESRVASDIRAHSGCETFSAGTLKEAADLVKSIVKPDSDVVVTLGAGNVWQVARDISREL